MNRDFLDFVEDVIESIKDALSFTEGMEYEDFVKDKKTLFAVRKSLEIIGEATKKIPAEVREQYQQIPWKEAMAMRDRLIHGYFAVDSAIVWKVVKNRLPALLPLFEKILEDYEVAKGEKSLRDKSIK